MVRIKKWVHFSKEVTVEISPADVIKTMREAIIDDDTRYAIEGALEVLIHISDTQIAKLSARDRKLFAWRMRRNAKRFYSYAHE